MPEEFVFGAKFNIEGLEELVKRIEGSLNKVGLAYEKEVSKNIKSTTEKGASSIKSVWSGVARDVIVSAFDPLISAQEHRVRVAPEIFGAIAGLLGEKMGAFAEGFAGQFTQRAKYIFTGAREGTASYAAQMARLELQPSKEMIENMLKVREEIYKRDYEARLKVAKIASEVLEKDYKETAEKGTKEAGQSFLDKLEADVFSILNKMANLSETMERLMEKVLGKIPE